MLPVGCVSVPVASVLYGGLDSAQCRADARLVYFGSDEMSVGEVHRVGEEVVTRSEAYFQTRVDGRICTSGSSVR